MDDRERIEAMVEEGRITREEADRLLGVLDDIDQAERQLEGVDAEVRSPESEPQPPGETHADRPEAESGTRPGPSLPPPPGAAAGGAAQEGERIPAGLDWLEVSLLAGDLEIQVDPAAGSPSASSRGVGRIELEKTETGYRLGGYGQKGDSFLERLMSGFSRGETTVTVPEGWGLRLNMKAGDVTVRGPLRFLAGHLLAGDLDVAEVHGIDLNVSAGDIDLGLRISDGKHRVHAVAGDVNVRLLDGSDAKVSGRVNIGDLSVPRTWQSRSKGIGSTFENTLGQGRAELKLDLGTGDLDVRVDQLRSAPKHG